MAICFNMNDTNVILSEKKKRLTKECLQYTVKFHLFKMQKQSKKTVHYLGISICVATTKKNNGLIHLKLKLELPLMKGKKMES